MKFFEQIPEQATTLEELRAERNRLLKELCEFETKGGGGGGCGSSAYRRAEKNLRDFERALVEAAKTTDKNAPDLVNH